jgi:segregation and condensation protein A
METKAGFTIQLPIFQGPFDLLLFFIERDEIDIYNIPIATVTNDFLDYIRSLEALNMDVASEFILVAATLMRIKSRMLLPRKEKDEAGNEIDPREELVDRLVEYKRYKEVLDELRALEEDRLYREPRLGIAAELNQIATRALVDVELESLSLFKLLQTYVKVLDRFEEAQKRPVHTVITYDYTISGERERIMKNVEMGHRLDFLGVFGHIEHRIHAFFVFLALLELISLQLVTLELGEGFNNFWVEKAVD